MKHGRFIIYGQSRSGSTLVQELMDSHPSICCDGELFCFNWGYIKSQTLLKLCRYYPFPYLRYRARRAAAPVYGFKLMFYQFKRPRPTIRRLARSGWKIIHVARRNLLQQSLSKLLASTTGNWHRRQGDGVRVDRVRIDEARLLAELEKRVRWKADESRILAGIEHLPIRYEDDLADPEKWDTTCKRAFAYLGVEPTSVQASTLKTYDRPYSELIANYQELMDFLRTTEFRKLLDEEHGSCRACSKAA